MLQYVKRMLQEEADLTAKIKRANKALETLKLDDTQKSLLEQQLGLMEEYATVLAKRIAYENNK